MTLQDLGYTDILEKYRTEHNLNTFDVGRVILEHKSSYIVKTPGGEYESELIGKLRFSSESRYDLPAVGDWVAFSEYDEGKALIHAVYPRSSIIERKAVGKLAQVQIIATNIDSALIVQAVDRDFNLNRLERYLIICNASNVKPIIVLSKIDLIDQSELESIIGEVSQRIKNVAIIPVSNTPNGYDALKNLLTSGKTFCLLGSSGVGKSTILNGLLGEDQMKTSAISTSVNKGRHTTSHRELVLLQDGGILIDNPGMREVGIADRSDGLESTFDTLLEYAQDCKFKDCTHEREDGCAVLMAMENGELSADMYTNFKKMEREKQFFELDAQERRKKDKDFGKMIKNVMKHKKDRKF